MAGGGRLASRSSRKVSQCATRWRVHEFRVQGVGAGEGGAWRGAALNAGGALLLWLSAGAAPALGAVALALPAGEERRALGCVLGGAGGGGGGVGSEAEAAVALARRLAARLARPVHVCCGAALDRLSAPLVERALLAEIQSHPELLQSAPVAV